MSDQCEDCKDCKEIFVRLNEMKKHKDEYNKIEIV